MPGQPAFPGHPAGPGQPAYPGLPAAYPGQPVYPGHPAFSGQPAAYPGQPAYPGPGGVYYGPMGPVAQQPVTSSPSDPLHWLLPVGRSWQSITAGYLGLLSLVFWVLGPLAIALGAWALVRASQEPGVHGRPRAVFGLLTGTLATFALFSRLF